MNNKFILLLWILISTITIYAQSSDSLQLINRLQSFEISNEDSLQNFKNLYFERNNDLALDNQISFLNKGIEAVDLLGAEDSIYFKFYFEIIGIYAVQFYDIEKTRALLDEISDKITIDNTDLNTGRYYHSLAITYYLEGDYVNALDYYVKAYQRFKEKFPKKARNALFNIVSIYSVLEDNKTAIKYAREALLLNKFSPEREAVFIEAFCYYQIGINYENWNKLDSAEYYVRKSIAPIDKIDALKDFSELQDYCAVNLQALLFFIKQGNKAEAEALFQKTAKCRGKVEPVYSLSMIEYYLLNGEFNKAAPLLADTSAIESYNLSRDVLLYFQSLYEEGIGNYKKALELHKEYYDSYQKMVDAQKVMYTTFADAKFETAKREAKINTLQKISSAENQKNNILILTIGLLLVLLLLALYAFRKSKSYNKLLENDLKNKEIIEKQAEELKQVDALKSKFFTNISHELRTPLTLISGSIEHILKKVNIDRTDEKQLRLAQRSSQQLLSVSEQMMSLIKGEVVEIKVTPVRFYWNDFLKSVLPAFEILVKNKDLSLSENKQYEGQVIIQSDLEKLQVILNNLIQNAVKFSKIRGTIELDSYEKGDFIEFCVKDTGIGISEEDLPKVLNRYYQSKYQTEAMGGFGIGLAVCQEYVKLLGGTIEIESKIDEGTTVKVSIPKTIGKIDSADFYDFDVTPVEAVTPTPVATKNIGTDEEAIQLLIVEDNIDLRDFLERILNEHYSLTFAFNGVDALKKLEKIKPDLIITDWMMPMMNGLKFVQELKENSSCNGIPVLMLSARSLPIDKLKAFQKGVDDYILKPFEIDLLKFRIERLLDLSLRRKESSDDELKYEEQQDESYNIKNKKDLVWISDLEKIIQQKMSDLDLVLENISSELGMSNVHLNRKVKAITGLTTMQFIYEIRFWEARRLLEEKEVLAVKVAAYSVGFKSVKNFSRNFKNRFGKYPSEYL